MTPRVIPLRPAADGDTDVSRRTFVKLLGASALAAGAAACAEPAGEIVPYVSQPPEVTPGVSLHFATAMEMDGYATGLVVASREGRPIKIEGNPDHPASLGATGAFEQAALLQLYDPDRAEFVKRDGEVAAWIDCAAAFSLAELRRRAGADGAGLRFLLEPTASPIVLDLIERVRQRFPRAEFHFYAPLVASAPADGVAIAAGRRLAPVYDLRQADVIVTADADLLDEGPFRLRYARQFADGRRVRHGGDRMNRLYAIEGWFTPTGVAADNRLAARPGDVPGIMASLFAAVAANTGAALPAGVVAAAQKYSTPHGAWAQHVARDLVAHRGRSLVVAGPRQPAIVHALAAGLNELLGATGRSVSYGDPMLPQDSRAGLAPLVEAIEAGQVSALVVLGGNPSYNAPADLQFAEAFKKVPLTLYAGPHDNETARDAHWFVPQAHFLEAWGDARALDGTTSIVQPLIAPLHGGRSTVDLLGFFAADDRPSFQIVRDFWRAADRLGSDEAWRDALRRGLVPGSAQTAATAAIGWTAIAAALAREAPAQARPLEIAFAPDPSVHDGRFSNNAWLQELPDPVTRITWDNAALMNEATARSLGVKGADVVDLAAGKGRVRAPVFLTVGMPDGLIALTFGYGRSAPAEQVADGVGSNAYAIWTSRGFTAGVSVAPATAAGVRLTHDFALGFSQEGDLDGRPILLNATLDRFNADPHFTAEHNGPVPTMYRQAGLGQGHQWGMAIDLTVCTGCNGCVVACQAENNIPVVGKLGVQERREMLWLRIDRYLGGAASAPEVMVQPMLCQQCENAPCEYVCPVNATVHSPDGLNEMVYNRCVGTRFCSNNCPYKVRRFNYLNYTAELPETEHMMMNPDVTVRARGVMEKCTFCVQRIRRADIDAGVSGSNAAYAHLQVACQQACPTRAIVFGSLTDVDAPVTADARADHSFRVLNDLGTRPRIHYLARLRNPNAALAPESV